MSDRYMHVASVTFGGAALPLPVSARLARRAEPIPAGGDADAFDTSVQTRRPLIAAEVRIRDTAAAEALALGQQAELCVTVCPTRSGQAGRTIRLAGAVLVAVELAYAQAEAASAVLRFVAEAPGGTTDPFSAEDAS